MGFELGGRTLSELPLTYAVEVDGWTGTASLSVDVPAAQGREAMGPALSLMYSSGSGNSEMGAGWNLAGISAIGLDTSEHAPRWDGTDGFQLSGNVLVPWLEADGLGWRPRTRELGAWQIAYYRTQLGGGQIRVERWVETATGRVHFRTRDARNVVTVYGARPAAAARIADPDDESRTYAWLPELRLDPHGTAMWLEYAAETLDGVDRAAPYEPLRPVLSQRYLKQIRYSNARPLVLDEDVLNGVLPAELRWCFHTVLDYGDHGDAPNLTPDRTWPARLDPTTSTRPGFPVRTYRLCRRILSFHEFAELAPRPTLVGALSLLHDERADGTTLRQISYTGYRNDGGSRTVPPLVMEYAPSVIDRAFEPAPIGSAQNAPAGLSGRNARFVDLFGEGLPGLLTEVDRTWHYKQNIGGGVYAAETIVVERPALREGGGSLGDFDSDGDTDLADLAGRFAGRFTFDRETRRAPC